MNRKAVSLFASSGIGDLALRAAGLNVIVANEIVEDRARLFQANFPETKMMQGDIWALKNQIIDATKVLLDGEELDLLIATPPCQGMSKNGQGKLLAEIRAGNRPAMDPRNRLIIPTVEIALALNPRIIIFENVPEMANTFILDESGELVKIVDYIPRMLGANYMGGAEVVEFADYGVPQRRQRLITIFTRDEELKSRYREKGSFISPPTHSQRPTSNLQSWLTLRSVIGSFPKLSGIAGHNAKIDFHELHRVPILDPKKYSWIKHTPPGKSAFDNQCINPKCGSTDNRLHTSIRSLEGINRTSTETPLYCERCGELLPRPFTISDGEKRLMKGFTSAYKRMSWDSPAPTLTTNLSYPSSDQNLHPDQNRVLSLFEAITLHTITDYEYDWAMQDGKPVSDGLIRDSIGESVPPRGLEKLISYLYREEKQARG
jgi:DNA (cytosine-5)-methyltransferase 1